MTMEGLPDSGVVSALFFFQFEVPITEVKLNGAVHWTVSSHAAQTFLEPVLRERQESNERHFHLLRLPSELRLRIYDMIFAFPPSGVRLRKNFEDEMDMTTVTRDLHDESSQHLWVAGRNQLRHRGLTKAGTRGARVFKCQSPSQLLSPLRLCKLINKEATPVFFDVNLFVFLRMEEMFDFLQRIGRERRKHVRHVLLNVKLHPRWEYPPEPGSAEGKKARRIEILNDCIGLTRVDMYAREDSEHQLWPDYEQPDFEKREIRQLIRVFAKLDKCEIRFGGECPTTFERTLEGYQEHGRIGRDMICS